MSELEITTTADKKYRQGLGASTVFFFTEWERNVTPGSEGDDTFKFRILGILGIELNDQGGSFIGLMPGGKWTVGIGVEREAKLGYKFEI